MSKSEATTGAKLGPRETSSVKSGSGVRAKPAAEGSRSGALAVPLGDGPASTPLGRMPTVRGHAVGGGLHATLAGPGGLAMSRLGRYQVVGRIATGGMAEVYLAVHGELAGFRTPVVLKKVLPHLACNPEFIDMFLDEARIASLLDHPNVVRIYEVGRSDSEYFLAMELVQGKPLQALLRRAMDTRSSVLEPRLAAFIVAQAAAGLHHAHNLTDPLGNTLGLVHRDVSPQNILLSFEGSVKVIDFGVARALGRITETQTGGMKGKFGYMSPEQARGEDLDLRADIFALGVVLWEAVTGKRLFQRDNDLATMRALIYDPIPRPSAVAPVVEGLESIIMRALARDPAQRFQTSRDLANALERFVVQSGGASASDLGGVMKTHFAQDYAIWQQTIRKAVNLPAIEESSIRAPSAGPGARGLLTSLVRRRPRLLAGIGAALVALVLVLVLAIRDPDASAAHAPDQRGLIQPTLEPPLLPLPGQPVPFGPPEPSSSGVREAPPRPALVAPTPGKSTRRKPPTPGRAPTRTKAPGGSDRRPNPF
jgi:eukaryotic-like serine/threonine-protein kinase